VARHIVALEKFRGFLLCGLLCWLLVPIFFALARFLQTKCKVFELTTQRFKITSGVFTKTTETLELYRIETRQPFFCDWLALRVSRRLHQTHRPHLL
jgi:hypothetical protein